MGIADATSFDNEGKPAVAIDWKSDVQPTHETLDRFRPQVRAYLDMTGTVRGLTVLVTTDQAIAVAPTSTVVAA